VGIVAERIVICEDDEDLAFVLREALIRKEYEVEIAPTAGALLDRLGSGVYDLILLDVKLPDMDGLDVIPKCREFAPETPIIVMTAHGTRPVAIDAINRGAYDFFTKPLKMAEFQVVVARALDRRRLQQQVKALRGGQGTGFEEVIGQSEPLRRVLDVAQRAAPTDLTILIEGESGTGKEVVARGIHGLSARRDGPLIPVNAAAIPEGLLESELFGHERGAFTGAESRKKGRFELANGGTIFLDEIGELSPAIQVKLLRVLQELEFERVGGTEAVKVDVRVVAATNRNLEKALAEGSFREDLYYRLNVFPIFIPPLRERRADVLPLADHFVEKYAREHGKTIKRISTTAIDQLASYHWPGNVRELENTIERAVLMADGEVIHGHHLPPTLQTAEATGTVVSTSLGSAVATFERSLIEDALKTTRGNRSKAARLLGTTERVINYKVKKYGIDPARLRA
jgi:Nif-specific regulatory protein